MAQTIVIGDIHGCYDELVGLLNKVSLQASDRVVAVGDLTVKGPKNREVLDLFSSDSRFSSVVGNHDLALVQHWRGQDITLRPAQKRAFNDLKEGGEHYFRYLGSLPFTIDLGSHIVLHAGLRPKVPLKEQSEEDLTELRTLGPDRTSRDGLPWYEVYSGPQFALFGHWPAAEPRRAKCAIGLDTGCVYGHQLTAYGIETGLFFSVPAAKIYHEQKPQF
jgi:hypothetical protein